MKGQAATTDAYNSAPTLIGTGLQIGADVASYKSKIGKYSTSKTTG